ncbi:MAG: hypothetical protein WKF96_17290 [Solirubrobacteraceae bacterium]
MGELPATARLDALAARFLEAELRVRGLLRQVLDGDRRTLLVEALAVLLALRRDAHRASANVEYAYLISALAMQALTGRPAVGTPVGGTALGARLAAYLDRLLVGADANARTAFATARPDNLADAEHLAVTGRIDRSGRRLTLAPEAEMLTRTSGVHAITRATRDNIGDAPATINFAPGSDAACHNGAGTGSYPPFHPNCRCLASPPGVTRAEHLAAMSDALNASDLARA